MKVYILTKKRFLILIFCIIICFLIIVLATYGISVTTAAQKRLIPIYNVETDKKEVAITFDVAWGADDTDAIISIFKKYNAKATFFVLGEWVDKNPQNLKKFYDAGHCIASHSNSHVSLSALSKNEVRSELKKCNEKIKKVTGKTPTLLRAPSGDYDNEVIEAAQSLNMYVIQWNLDSLDYEGLSTNEIYKRIVPNVSNGSIILFHTDVDNTLVVLPRIIEALQSKGYNLVTVDQLIYKDNYEIDNTGTQKLKNSSGL